MHEYGLNRSSFKFTVLILNIFCFLSIAANLTKFIHKIIFKGTNSKFQKYEIQETRSPEQPRGKNEEIKMNGV